MEHVVPLEEQLQATGKKAGTLEEREPAVKGASPKKATAQSKRKHWQPHANQEVSVPAAAATKSTRLLSLSRMFGDVKTVSPDLNHPVISFSKKAFQGSCQKNDTRGTISEAIQRKKLKKGRAHR
jgi:hypothetical protein